MAIASDCDWRLRDPPPTASMLSADGDGKETGAGQVPQQHMKMERVQSTKVRRDHSRQHSHSRHQQAELKTVGEYALHHLFNSVRLFSTRGKKQMVAWCLTREASLSAKRTRRFSIVWGFLISPSPTWKTSVRQAWTRSLTS